MRKWPEQLKKGINLENRERNINTVNEPIFIREDKIPQIYSAIQTGRAQGMRTLEQHLKELKEKGVIEG